MDIEYYIRHFGYVALMIGTILEGETFLVMAALAAAQGYLSIEWVLILAYIGSLIGDQVPFFLGRFKGREYLNKRPLWRKRCDLVFKWLTRHRIKVLLFYRFLYGFRVVTPFVFGLTSIRIRHFIMVNAVAALAWTGIVGVAGYYLGESLEEWGVDLRYVEFAIAGVIILVIVSYWVTGRSQNNDEPPPNPPPDRGQPSEADQSPQG